METRILGTQLMEVSDMVYLTTVQPDGYPHTRSVWNLRNRKSFGRLWPFFKEHNKDFLVLFGTNTSSNKIKHIIANPKVSAYYCDPADYRGLTLIGDAVIDDDMEIKKVLWDPAWTFYYPKGIEGPDFSVIRLKPRRAKYYHRGEVCDFAV